MTRFSRTVVLGKPGGMAWIRGSGGGSMDITNRQSLRWLPLLLAGMLFLWQLCLVYHQAEHNPGEPHEVCQLCQAADHMQHGLSATVLPAIVRPSFILPRADFSTRYAHPARTPSARGPPVHQTV